MEGRPGQIHGRDFHEDLQQLGRIAAEIGSDDLEEEIHLCFSNGFSQKLSEPPIVRCVSPLSGSTKDQSTECSPKVLTSKTTLVEMGWISVLTQMESNARVYSHWTELLPSVVNPSIQSKFPHLTVNAELNWDLWLATTLLSVAVLGDLLMTASSPVFETTKLPGDNSSCPELSRSLSSHLKDVSLRGYVSLSQVHQKMLNELRRIPPISCYTPIQLSELVKLPTLLVNLEDITSRIFEIHKAQSNEVAGLFITGALNLEEDFGRHNILQLLETASVVFVQLFHLWRKMEEFFAVCFYANGEDIPEKNIVEPLEMILHCINLLGDLITTNPGDVHRTWQNLIASCKNAIVVV